MVLPIVTPALVVASHAEAFRDLFDNQGGFLPLRFGTPSDAAQPELGRAAEA